MSEMLEKVSGIDHLPIFPLPLVLLPTEILPLHIFEPKYRQMLEDAKAAEGFIGINFYDPEQAFDERPVSGSIGCMAELLDVQTMEDGRSNVYTTGLIRYRVAEYIDIGKPYLTAEIEFFEDEPEDRYVLDPLADEIFLLFERIAKAAFDLSGNRGSLPAINRTEPEHLSFLVTAAFNLDSELKYSLISTRKTSERLIELRKILKPAAAKIEENSTLNKAAKTNGHSKKPIDL